MDWKIDSRPLTWSEPLPGPEGPQRGGPLGEVELARTGPGLAVVATRQYADCRVFEVDLEAATCRDLHRQTARWERHDARTEDGRFVRLRPGGTELPLPFHPEATAWLGPRCGTLRWIDHRVLGGVDHVLTRQDGTASILGGDLAIVRGFEDPPLLEVPRRRLAPEDPLGAASFHHGSLAPRMVGTPERWVYEVGAALYALDASADAPPLALGTAEHPGRLRPLPLTGGDLLVLEQRGGASPAEHAEAMDLAWRETEFEAVDEEGPPPDPETLRAFLFPRGAGGDLPFEPGVELGEWEGRLAGDPTEFPGRGALLFLEKPRGGTTLHHLDPGAGSLVDLGHAERSCQEARWDGATRTLWWIVSWPDEGTGSRLAIRSG